MSHRTVPKRCRAAALACRRCSVGHVPRPPRPNIAGGIYHIGSRGVRRLPLFEDLYDYRRFLAWFKALSVELRWICHVRVQMPNHFHLVVETPHPNLSIGMQRLNSRYAQWFNWRHGYEGHVVDRRFYSGVIETDAHLLELARYILLNPVRAGLCTHPADWPFSSYGEELSERLAGQFSRNAMVARIRFERFVLEGVLPGRVSGSDPGTRPDQPKPYVPAKRFARSLTTSAPGRPTTFR
jgi:putative transposase